MIEIDHINALRNARLLSVIVGALCISCIACPWSPPAYVLLTIFAVFFMVRALEYSTRIREHELDTESFLSRERRERAKQQSV